MYLADPRSGRRRRHMLRDRAYGLSRRGLRQTMRLERQAQSNLYGRLMAARHRQEPPKEYDDITLVHKVETLLYRDPLVPKGHLNIDACDGIITVRGMIDSQEMIDRIVEDIRHVQSVRGVENPLHRPGTTPPNLEGGSRARIPA
ncbi:MAG: BON domain-containing protein [Rhodospirillaceae bacterium]